MNRVPSTKGPVIVISLIIMGIKALAELIFAIKKEPPAKP